MVNDQASSKKSHTVPAHKIWLYLYRALHLRCPSCGISPIFLPLRRVEDLTDWFATLDGCPRCNYPYHREPGYFLFALWMINFSIVAVVGVVEVLILGNIFDASTPVLMFFTLVLMWLLGILSVRHTKSVFMALDHLVHPPTSDPDETPPPVNLAQSPPRRKDF